MDKIEQSGKDQLHPDIDFDFMVDIEDFKPKQKPFVSVSEIINTVIF